MPRVSVILATFNRAHLLPDAIRSALAQTERDFELIVVDDGSTDDTAARALAFADARVRVLRSTNRGLADARNLGISVATGAWLAFLDDDDLYAPDHLSARLRYVDGDPGIDGTWGGLLPVGPPAKHWVRDLERDGEKIHVAECHISGTLFLRRAAVVALEGFRAVPCEDYDLCRRFEARYRLERVAFPTYLYRVGAAANRISDALH